MPFAPADHDPPARGAHVADPLRLTGEGHQVMAAVAGGPQHDGAADHSRAAARDLQRDHISWAQAQGGDDWPEPAQAAVPTRWRPVGVPAAGVVDWLEKPAQPALMCACELGLRRSFARHRRKIARGLCGGFI